MKIGLLYLGKSGGISQCMYELAKALSPIADVICYLPSQNTMLDQFAALPCQMQSFPMRRGAKSLLRSIITNKESSGIAAAILKDAPDIILDAGSGAWGDVIHRQIRGRIPIAAIIHDVTRHPGLWALRDALPNMIRPCIADAVVSLSDFSHRELVRKYPNKAHIQSRHGIIMPTGNVDSQLVAERRKKLLFFGRIDPYKGLDVLVKAFGIAKKVDPELSLTIIGRGTIAKNLRDEISHLNIGLVNRYVSDDEISKAVQSHGVIVLPYTSATQSGVAAIALANGLPCVASDVGALPEQVIDGENGLIVPPNDPQKLASALLEISHDCETAARMSEATFHLGNSRYSWDVIAEELVDKLQEFAEKCSRRVS